MKIRIFTFALILFFIIPKHLICVDSNPEYLELLNSLNSNTTGFIENKGQWVDDVLFAASSVGYNLIVKHHSITLVQNGKGNSIPVTISFVNSESNNEIIKMNEITAKFNFFYGSDSSKWVAKS